jgi:hypothetical protein
LIISGYHPDKKLLEHIKYPINLYCYDETSYKVDDDEVHNKNNLIYWISNNLDMVNKYFSNIYLVNIKNGYMTKYNDILQLDLDVKKFISKNY